METTYVKRQRGYQLGVFHPSRHEKEWKQTDKQNKQTNKQTNRQTDKQTNKQTNKPKKFTRWLLPKQGVNAPEAVADANGGLRP